MPLEQSRGRLAETGTDESGVVRGQPGAAEPRDRRVGGAVEREAMTGGRPGRLGPIASAGNDDRAGVQRRVEHERDVVGARRDLSSREGVSHLVGRQIEHRELNDALPVTIEQQTRRCDVLLAMLAEPLERDAASTTTVALVQGVTAGADDLSRLEGADARQGRSACSRAASSFSGSGQPSRRGAASRKKALRVSWERPASRSICSSGSSGREMRTRATAPLNHRHIATSVRGPARLGGGAPVSSRDLGRAPYRRPRDG